MKLNLVLSGFLVAAGVTAPAALPENRPVSQPAASALEAGFRSPPPAARPWVYWFIMDGNFSREGITADLEAMQRAGIGGVLLMEVNVGLPQGPVKFMSEEWRALFKHAVEEAERLGLEITLNAGPGWTGSGGPWVKAGQSMQHLVASAVEVTGPTNFNAILPRPAPRPPYFGNGGLPAEMVQAQEAFFADVAVLVFPKPATGPLIADLDEKALFLRHPYSSQPGTKPFLPAPADFPETAPATAITRGGILDLTDRLQPDGRLAWAAPAGEWTILRFILTSTGANTRPAPQPGLGLECDKFDPVALDAHFDAFVGTLLRTVGPRPINRTNGWTMLHIDSWEMGAQNWTANFRAEFQRRRGYDPRPFLPAYTGRLVESLEITERFLWDLRQTAQELVIANHAQHLKDLGHQHGFGLSIEPYDMNPCADLALGAVADVPMCEFWADGDGFVTAFSCIEAVSIAHTVGRPIVAAEAFTAGGREAWTRHPGAMKNQADWALAAGINRFAFHRYAHQPWLGRAPGMTMGRYGTQYDRTQTWWELSGAWHEYLTRCQFVLRQGLPVADVLYLAPEGAPQVFRAPPSALGGSAVMPDRRGYNFDGCDPQALIERVTVQEGKLTLPDGMSYRVLVLPERDTMTPALLHKLKELVTAGATVVGPPPRKSPSLAGYPECDKEVKTLAAELWGDADGERIKEHALGKGRVRWDRDTSKKVSSDPANPLAVAKWIWFPEGNPAASAPVGRRSFRRTVTLPPDQPIASARLFLTADNSFELFVNGHPAATGDSFHETESLDVATLLRPGTNILAIAAENAGDAPNPAGLVGALLVKFRHGRELKATTDRQWESASVVTTDWKTNLASTLGWRAAQELGPFDMAPWNRKSQPAGEPPQYGDFAVVSGVLREANVPWDFESDGPVRYLHRRHGDAEIYFVANREPRRVNAACVFRVSGRTPELWDPETGTTRTLSDFAPTPDGRTAMPLRFEPTQSYFIVFRQPPATRATPSRAKNFPEFKTIAEVRGPWHVSFPPNWDAPAEVMLDPLISWSDHSDPGVKHFSGTATYRRTLTVPAGLPTPGQSLWLDLGDVQVMAEVTLNGRKLGAVWKPPFRVNLTAALKSGDNALEVRVVNLWPNRMIGDAQLPEDTQRGKNGFALAWPPWLLAGRPSPTGRFTFAAFDPWQKASPLLPSGLLGPVRLQVEAESTTP